MLHKVSICLHQPVTGDKDLPSRLFTILRYWYYPELILLGGLQLKFPSVWVDPGTSSSWLQSKEGFIHLVRHFSVPCCFILESCNVFWQAYKASQNTNDNYMRQLYTKIPKQKKFNISHFTFQKSWRWNAKTCLKIFIFIFFYFYSTILNWIMESVVQLQSVVFLVLLHTTWAGHKANN